MFSRSFCCRQLWELADWNQPQPQLQTCICFKLWYIYFSDFDINYIIYNSHSSCLICSMSEIYLNLVFRGWSSTKLHCICFQLILTASTIFILHLYDFDCINYIYLSFIWFWLHQLYCITFYCKQVFRRVGWLKLWPQTWKLGNHNDILLKNVCIFTN